MNPNIFIKSIATLSAAILMLSCSTSTQQEKKLRMPSKLTLSKETLMDKIKGGWAGQVIGCTYGGPTEFRWRAKMIPDSENIPWGEPDYIEQMMKRQPGLYDDIYMDLTFVESFERLGIDAPVDSIALAFAHAKYPLWHANQVARHNILYGIMPPMSGHWHNNPHADDIDYQIEADYAGIMSPAMPNSASEISDRIGHIMNYGDGWYGGVYVGAMYALAFATDDIEAIVCEALKTIPQQSKFYKLIDRVIKAYRTYPDDWKKCWQVCHEELDGGDFCTEGVHAPLNIDASMNSAYIVIGLLYGQGDFTRTLDITTRCGQDSDCNPASAGGILATAMGYSNIPEEWIAPLKRAEDIDFAYTTTSLNETYQMSYSHALEMIERGGGKAGEITDHAAAERDDKIGSGQPGSGEGFKQFKVARTAFGGLTCRQDGQRRGEADLTQAVKHAVGIERCDIFVADHDGATGRYDLGQLFAGAGEQAAFDQHRIHDVFSFLSVLCWGINNDMRRGGWR